MTSGSQEPHILPRSNPRRPFSMQIAARFILGTALFALGLWLLWDFISAIAWAVIFAIVLWPVYNRFCTALPGAARRNVAPVLATLLVALIFIVPLAFAAAEAVRDIRFLVGFVVEAQRDGVPLPGWLHGLPMVGPGVEDWWNANLADPQAAADLFGRANTHTLVQWTRTLGFEIAQRLTLFAFTLLTLFFLFRDGRSLVNRATALGDRVVGASGKRIASHMVASVHATVNGLVLVGLAEGALLTVAYFIAGVPHAALAGALTGILAIVPFGAPLIFCIAALVLFAQHATVAAALVAAFGFLVVFIADHVVRPVVIGGAVRLPFLWVLLGLLGGIETFGLLGLFLGPAIMAALVSLWREWTDPHHA